MTTLNHNSITKKKFKEEFTKLIKHLNSQIQTDSYGDKVLTHKGTVKNLKEFKKLIFVEEAGG